MSTFDRRRVALVFGAILRTARMGAAMTQEQLADGSDIDRTYPSLMERGLRQPSPSMLLRLADALGMPAATLVTNLTRHATSHELARQEESRFAPEALRADGHYGIHSMDQGR